MINAAETYSAISASTSQIGSGLGLGVGSVWDMRAALPLRRVVVNAFHVLNQAAKVNRKGYGE